MDDMSSVYEWAKTSSFDEMQIHCATFIALEILDASSNMDYDDYNLFISMYEGLCDNGQITLDGKIHKIIALSLGDDPIIPKTEYKEVIHSLRLAMLKNIDLDEVELFKKLVWDNQE